MTPIRRIADVIWATLAIYVLDEPPKAYCLNNILNTINGKLRTSMEYLEAAEWDEALLEEARAHHKRLTASDTVVTLEEAHITFKANFINFERCLEIVEELRFSLLDAKEAFVILSKVKAMHTQYYESYISLYVNKIGLGDDAESAQAVSWKGDWGHA